MRLATLVLLLTASVGSGQSVLVDLPKGGGSGIAVIWNDSTAPCSRFTATCSAIEGDSGAGVYNKRQ